MFAFVVQRLIQAIMVMVSVAFIAFLLFQYVGDPVLFMLGQDATADQIAALRKDLGNAISFVQPQGGLFVWANLTGANGQVKDGNAFAKMAIDKGVAFVPGAPFFCQNPDHSTLRFSFATVGEDKILEGVDRLKQAMDTSVSASA